MPICTRLGREAGLSVFPARSELWKRIEGCCHGSFDLAGGPGERVLSATVSIAWAGDELSNDKLAEKVAKWLTELARLCAIVFFLYCAYEGVFNSGGSTMVFIGVLALLFILVLCHFLEQIPKLVSR
jgi:hypothetical protein